MHETGGNQMSWGLVNISFLQVARHQTPEMWSNIFSRLEQVRTVGSRPQRVEGQRREGRAAKMHRKKLNSQGS